MTDTKRHPSELARTRERIVARIARLEADNAAAPGWGAAVGARLEEIGELRAELRRHATPPDAQPAGTEGVREKLADLCARIDASERGCASFWREGERNIFYQVGERFADAILAAFPVLTSPDRYAEALEDAARAAHEACCELDLSHGTARQVAERVRALSGSVTVQAQGRSYQARVDDWLLACFGEEIARDRMERNHRFIEEALETVQANGCTRSEAHQLVDYVFDRPAGDLHQEVGGVMNTLAALCLASGIDMAEAGEIELARVWTKVEKIRAKQAAKPKHSPLPEHVQPQGGDDADGVRERAAEIMKPLLSGATLIERLHTATACRRCGCPACRRSGFENHDHGCTDGEGCRETREKLRNALMVRTILCGQAAIALQEAEAALATTREELAEARRERDRAQSQFARLLASGKYDPYVCADYDLRQALTTHDKERDRAEKAATAFSLKLGASEQQLSDARRENERLREGLKQIKATCSDNEPAGCAHNLALRFVGDVAARALTAADTGSDAAQEGRADG